MIINRIVYEAVVLASCPNRQSCSCQTMHHWGMGYRSIRYLCISFCSPCLFLLHYHHDHHQHVIRVASRSRSFVHHLVPSRPSILPRSLGVMLDYSGISTGTTYHIEYCQGTQYNQSHCDTTTHNRLCFLTARLVPVILKVSILILLVHRTVDGKLCGPAGPIPILATSKVHEHVFVSVKRITT